MEEPELIGEFIKRMFMRLYNQGFAKIELAYLEDILCTQISVYTNDAWVKTQKTRLEITKAKSLDELVDFTLWQINGRLGEMENSHATQNDTEAGAPDRPADRSTDEETGDHL